MTRSPKLNQPCALSRQPPSLNKRRKLNFAAAICTACRDYFLIFCDEQIYVAKIGKSPCSSQQCGPIIYFLRRPCRPGALTAVPACCSTRDGRTLCIRLHAGCSEFLVTQKITDATELNALVSKFRSTCSQIFFCFEKLGVCFTELRVQSLPPPLHTSDSKQFIFGWGGGTKTMPGPAAAAAAAAGLLNILFTYL